MSVTRCNYLEAIGKIEKADEVIRNRWHGPTKGRPRARPLAGKSARPTVSFPSTAPLLQPTGAGWWAIRRYRIRRCHSSPTQLRHRASRPWKTNNQGTGESGSATALIPAIRSDLTWL